MIRYALAAGFLACIPAANWLIGNVGTVCIPQGPCLIPVAPGMMAPSGVLMIGAALALRDAVQEALGRAWVFALVIAGAALSLLFSPPALAIASATAFLLSELTAIKAVTRANEQRDAAQAKAERLRRGWLTTIQQENSCPATGGGCLANWCGCIEEMKMLMREADEMDTKEPGHE